MLSSQCLIPGAHKLKGFQKETQVLLSQKTFEKELELLQALTCSNLNSTKDPKRLKYYTVLLDQMRRDQHGGPEGSFSKEQSRTEAEPLRSSLSNKAISSTRIVLPSHYHLDVPSSLYLHVKPLSQRPSPCTLPEDCVCFAEFRPTMKPYFTHTSVCFLCLLAPLQLRCYIFICITEK